MAPTPLAKFPRPSLAVEPSAVLDMLSMFGLPGYQCAVGLAVFTSESFLDAYAFNLVNDPHAEHHHSIDAGYTAINFTYYWPLSVAFRPQTFPPLTSRQVFDPVCATAAAVIIFVDAGGRANPVKGWSRWTQFKNGKYLPHRAGAIALAKTNGARATSTTCIRRRSTRPGTCGPITGPERGSPPVESRDLGGIRIWA